MFFVGDKVFFGIYSLPEHPLTQYPGVGLGDASYCSGDKYSIRIVSGEIISLDRSYGLAKVWLPGELVFNGLAWVKPTNSRGVPEKICWVVTLSRLGSTATEAREIASESMPR